MTDEVKERKKILRGDESGFRLLIATIAGGRSPRLEQKSGRPESARRRAGSSARIFLLTGASTLIEGMTMSQVTPLRRGERFADGIEHAVGEFH